MCTWREGELDAADRRESLVHSCPKYSEENGTKVFLLASNLSRVLPATCQPSVFRFFFVSAAAPGLSITRTFFAS